MKGAVQTAGRGAVRLEGEAMKGAEAMVAEAMVRVGPKEVPTEVNVVARLDSGGCGGVEKTEETLAGMEEDLEEGSDSEGYWQKQLQSLFFGSSTYPCSDTV